jgi:hypothetical protein
MQTFSLTDAPQNDDSAIASRVLKHVRYPLDTEDAKGILAQVFPSRSHIG